MDVSVLTMNTLFQKNIRYLIPEFQRPYVWNQEDQWEPLWDDLRNTAEEFIEGGQPIRKSRPHFPRCCCHSTAAFCDRKG